MNREKNQTGWLRSRSGVALVCFLAIIGLLLLTEHRAHILGALPYLLLLACPLLHVFHHQGHSHHANDQDPVRPSGTKPPVGHDPAHHQGGAS